ncbi:MAG: response regulator [Acidobacteria bacterium]|nr:response regulator [Acidobacteriota bacterium]
MSYSGATMQTIMVVEDDDDSRLMMKTLLELKGYRVLDAASGEEALARAEQDRPGLILMDLQLPRLSGLAVARRVRQHAQLSETPIIIVSGHDPLQHRQLALAAGCNEFLHKPLDFDLLEQTLDRLLPVDMDG